MNKILTFYSDTHKILYEDYFLKSYTKHLSKDFKLLEKKIDQISVSGDFASFGFDLTMMEKIKWILDNIDLEDDGYLVFADCDIQFFRNLEFDLDSFDILFQHDFYDKNYCAGFFICRQNEKVLNFFKMVYEDNLFGKGGSKAVLKHPHLEADDCIAISVKYVLDKYPDAKIYIITSDKDYLQLAKPNVEIYSLAYKKLTDQKSSTGNPECDLFCKIVMGDISDNIKSVLKKCGPKTAMKCYENREYFEERLKNENAYDLYKFNETLVDFNKIPQELADEFIYNNITNYK